MSHLRNLDDVPRPAAEARSSEIIEKDGGRDRDRTCDPYDVNVVLFR